MTKVLIEDRDSSLTINKFQANGLTVSKLSVLRDGKVPALCLDSKAAMVKQWQHYIEQEIGFVLPKAQSKWLLNAVEQTAAKYKLSVVALWDAVQTNSQLRQQLLDTVLIPESRFFRHEPSIDFIIQLAKQYDTKSLKAAESLKKDIKIGVDHHGADKEVCSLDEPFRIWSVGCATGQEVWSLAMALAGNDLANYTVLGTDVSQQALATARKGQYHQRQKTLIPPNYQRFIQPLTMDEKKGKQAKSQDHCIFDAQTLSSRPTFSDKQLSNETETHWQVVPKLHEQVRFIWHNIFTKSLATPHLQQVILCQNMLIYFRQFDQRDILARLAAQCVIGGYIILAPGEALFWRPSNMRRVAHTQINAWQKISA